MWDDHEIANDPWMHGAQNHDPETDGDWEVRKRAAVQAYLDRRHLSADEAKDYGLVDQVISQRA